MNAELNPGPLQKKSIYLLTRYISAISGLVSYTSDKLLSTNYADSRHVGCCGSYYSDFYNLFFYPSSSLPLSPTYSKCRAGRRVRGRRARNIHRVQSVVSYQRASRGSDNLHKGSISNNLCVVTPVNINNHSSPNVTSTNPSLHTNLLVNPRSALLNFVVFNSRSVRNKIESIIDHVVENDIGLCTVTETWLYDDDSVSIAQLTVAGYFFKNFSRQSQNRGGGTEILFRDSANVSIVNGKENKSFEYSEWIAKVHYRPMRHIVVYRPPYSSLDPVSASVFFNEFSQVLKNVVMCPEVLVICGDFNLHLDDLLDNYSKKLMDLQETFSLSQHVSRPTHQSGHTLDLIITHSMRHELGPPTQSITTSSLYQLFNIACEIANSCCMFALKLRRIDEFFCHPLDKGCRYG